MSRDAVEHVSDASVDMYLAESQVTLQGHYEQGVDLILTRRVVPNFKTLLLRVDSNRNNMHRKTVRKCYPAPT